MGKDYYSWLRQWIDAQVDTSILFVSRGISEEALDVLYGENTYEIRLGESDQNFIGRFAPGQPGAAYVVCSYTSSPWGCGTAAPIEIESQIWIPHPCECHPDTHHRPATRVVHRLLRRGEAHRVAGVAATGTPVYQPARLPDQEDCPSA